MPTVCPVCGAPVVREEGEAVARCIGIECKCKNIKKSCTFLSQKKEWI